MNITQIAAQLYTVRDYTKTGAEFSATLRKIKKTGYQAIELAGAPEVPDSEIAERIADAGLTLCSSHESPQLLLDEPARVVDRLLTLGAPYGVYPYPAGVDFSEAEKVESFISKLDSAGNALCAAGLHLAYHNHAHEFVRYGEATLFETLYARIRPERLYAELDTFWVQAGGMDPSSVCDELNGRIALLHLKDYSVSAMGVRDFSEVGYGNLNFQKIISAAERSGCQWFVVEQDVCPGNPFDSLAKSFEFVQAHFLS